jgi:thiol-disulfide isomerase/thioredoxin
MIRSIVVFLAAMLLLQTADAQTSYTSEDDPKQPGAFLYKGRITHFLLANTPSFSWYASRQATYKPSVPFLNAFESARGKVRFLIFGGTWCEDTQSILPTFFKAQAMAGFPDSDLTFYAVDRSKKTMNNEAQTYAITNVPTIIVLRDGQEVGRVVEYGKTGKWEEEMTQLLLQH